MGGKEKLNSKEPNDMPKKCFMNFMERNYDYNRRRSEKQESRRYLQTQEESKIMQEAPKITETSKKIAS